MLISVFLYMYSEYKIVLSVQLPNDITNVIDIKLTFVLNSLNFFKATIVLLTSKQNNKMSYNYNTKAAPRSQRLDMDIYIIFQSQDKKKGNLKGQSSNSE